MHKHMYKKLFAAGALLSFYVLPALWTGANVTTAAEPPLFKREHTPSYKNNGTTPPNKGNNKKTYQVKTHNEAFGKIKGRSTLFDDFSAISIGTAIVTQPKFLGASESEVRIFPLIQGAYNLNDHQQIYLRGLELGYAYAYNENFQFGIDITPRRGRAPEEDQRLNGLDEINTSFEVGPWVKLRWHGLRFQTNIRTDISGEHNGVLATFKLSHKVEPLPGFRFTAYAQTEWASSSFMDTFFSVNAAQATPERPRFKASSGFYQSTLGGTFNHRLHKDVFLWVDAQAQFLHKDAKRSSLSFNNKDFRGILGIGYTF